MEESTVAIEAAQKAGKVLLEKFGNVQSIQMKQHNEIVTEADLAAEKVILEMIREKYPHDAILSEESGRSGDGDRLWIIDPLDGTTNYSQGVPFFNVTIALAEKRDGVHQVVSGVVHAPFTQEVFFAEKGEGAFRNGEPIQVSNEEDAKNAYIAYCFGRDTTQIQRAAKAFGMIRPQVSDFMRLKSAALELALVAHGRLNGFVLFGGKPWDVAAGSLLVKEAGGLVTDFTGKDWTLDSKDLLATNKQVYETVRDLLNASE